VHDHGTGDHHPSEAIVCGGGPDAEAAGVTDEEIAAVLFDGDAAALADCRREAHALRDGGYREIAFYPE